MNFELQIEITSYINIYIKNNTERVKRNHNTTTVVRYEHYNNFHVMQHLLYRVLFV